MLLFYGLFLQEWFLLVSFLPVLVTKVKANQDLGGQGGPPPAFVAVVPTSIIGDFQGFPYLLETETTTTTTTTTPAPFGKIWPLLYVLIILLQCTIAGSLIILEQPHYYQFCIWTSDFYKISHTNRVCNYSTLFRNKWKAQKNCYWWSSLTDQGHFSFSLDITSPFVVFGMPFGRKEYAVMYVQVRVVGQIAKWGDTFWNEYLCHKEHKTVFENLIAWPVKLPHFCPPSL